MKYLEQIPASWSQVKLKDYLKLLPIIEDLDDDAEVLQAAFYVFTNQMINQVDIKPEGLTAIQNRLLFIGTPPIGISNIKWQQLNELDFQSYINYQKLAEEPIDNLHEIVKIFAPDGVDVENVSVEDAMACFFLQSRIMKKRLIYFQISLLFKILVQIVKIFWQKKKQWLLASIKKNGAGY
ncbi:hypothetical protein [Pedobacter aquatilis]|uniref:hypothetical protein n=1 Tax=Pedobacter aquatilis TaxID=351343 RepID=UPI00292F12C8|nr:hypothetical protein [Pedobacter aquatilis]